MNIEQEIISIKNRLASLQDSLIQMQKNQTSTTNKADNTSAQVNIITPTTLTATAYIDDTEVIFTDVPYGNITVYFDHQYTITREGNNVIISFDPLEEVTTITISIL